MAICLQCGETMRKCTCESVLTCEREIEKECLDIDTEVEFATNYQNQN